MPSRRTARPTLLHAAELALGVSAVGLLYALYNRLGELQFDVQALARGMQQLHALERSRPANGEASLSADAPTVAEATEEADRLYEAGKTAAAYQSLAAHKDGLDSEVRWRIARLCNELADAQAMLRHSATTSVHAAFTSCPSHPASMPHPTPTQPHPTPTPPHPIPSIPIQSSPMQSNPTQSKQIPSHPVPSSPIRSHSSAWRTVWLRR